MKQLLYAAVLLIASASLCPAQHAQLPQGERTINVNTNGEAKAWPDVAQMTFRIAKENPLASRALIEVREESKRFQAALDKIGLDESISVSERGIVLSSQNTRYRSSGQPQGGFTASNEYTLEFPLQSGNDNDKALGLVVKITDSLNPEGFTPVAFQNTSGYGNEQSIVQYAVSDFGDMETKIYQEAIEKNRPEADQMAGRMNLKIIGIRSSNMHIPQSYSYRQPGQDSRYAVTGSVYKEYSIQGTFNATYIVEEK